MKFDSLNGISWSYAITLETFKISSNVFWTNIFGSVMTNASLIHFQGAYIDWLSSEINYIYVYVLANKVNINVHNPLCILETSTAHTTYAIWPRAVRSTSRVTKKYFDLCHESAIRNHWQSQKITAQEKEVTPSTWAQEGQQYGDRRPAKHRVNRVEGRTVVWYPPAGGCLCSNVANAAGTHAFFTIYRLIRDGIRFVIYDKPISYAITDAATDSPCAHG